jgi:hypothetical protein
LTHWAPGQKPCLASSEKCSLKYHGVSKRLFTEGSLLSRSIANFATDKENVLTDVFVRISKLQLEAKPKNTIHSKGLRDLNSKHDIH